jgi:hypothetical protein
VQIQDIQRHFPFLLGKLPRLLAISPGILAALVRRFIVELLLAIPFVGIFITAAVVTWGSSFLFAQVIAIAVAVLPLSYLVLLLMVRQPRERRQKPTNGLPTLRDDEV